MKKNNRGVNIASRFTLIFLFSLIILVSCKSNSALVPGQKKLQIKNIYIEYMNIADAYYSLEKYDNAITYYKNCLNEKSLYNTAYYKLGLCYVKSSKWSLAEPVFVDLLKKDLENASLKDSLAYIYCMEAKLEESINLYNELTSEYSDNSTYLENYIAVLIADKNYTEAGLQLEKLKASFPDSTKISKIEEEIKKQTEADNQSAETSGEKSEISG